MPAGGRLRILAVSTLIATSTALAIGGIGCGPDLPTPEESAVLEPDSWVEYPPRTSPASVLTYWRLALVNRDLDRYALALDPSYTFLATTSAGDTAIHLDRQADLAATDEFCRVVESVKIGVIHDLALPFGDPPQDPTFPVEDGYREIAISEVHVRVRMKDDPLDPTIFVGSTGPAIAVFRPDSTASPVTWTLAHLRGSVSDSCTSWRLLKTSCAWE